MLNITSFLIPLAMLSTLSTANIAILSPGMTWANLAWGFSDGGIDSTRNASMILLDPDHTEKEAIDAYKSDGKTVLCYLSVGTIEKSRQDYLENKDKWDRVLLGQMDDWDETWIDIRQIDAVLPLIGKRLDKLAAKGCQGVEPDNMDCYGNEDCWSMMDGISSGDDIISTSIDFLMQLGNAAHDRNLAIVVKNAVAIAPELAQLYDGAITENCVHYNECQTYEASYVLQGKAHFAVEYGGNANSCKKTYPKMNMKYCKATDSKNKLCAGKSGWKQCPVK